MAKPNVAKVNRTFVHQLKFGCLCLECPKKAKKKLKTIHGIGSISVGKEEGKITITGSMVDSCTITTKLKDFQIKATLFSEETPIENVIEKKQIILRKSEVIEGRSKVVFCKPADNRKVVDEFASNLSPDIPSKHEHKLELKNCNERTLIKEKQIIPRKSEVINGQSKVVVCKPADNSEVVDKFALSLSPDIPPKHEHKLELKNWGKRFTCNGCKEVGFGSRHRCEQCNYDLHPNCFKHKPTVNHELFKGSIFKFSDKRPIPTCGDKDCRTPVHRMTCGACGNEIHGYFYHCKAKNLGLHPCCINLKAKLCIEGLTFSLERKTSLECRCCKSKQGVNSGWSYISKCKTYQFHVKCFADMMHEAWKQKADEDVAAYSMEPAKILAMVLSESKRNGKPLVPKFVNMIIWITSKVIRILFGDLTAIAPIVFEIFEIFKN